MSDTPRTDAECMSGETRYTDMVHYTFAQQLERELADVNADYMYLARRLDGHDATECLLNLNRLKIERDKLAEALEIISDGATGYLDRDAELADANAALSILQGCGLHPKYYDNIEKAAEGVRDIIRSLRADLHDPPHDIQCAVLHKLGVEGFTKEGVAPTHQLIPLANDQVEARRK